MINDLIKINQHFDIPNNIAEFLNKKNGVNLSININPCCGDDCYVWIVHYSVVLSMLTRTCHRCGYDPLWKPDEDESKCIRHSYNAWRYDTVFAWSPRGTQLTLEEAFDVWLKSQPKGYGHPVKKMTFGKIGWS